MLVMVFVFPLSAKLVLMERNSLLPSMPARGHGLVLLVFWILIFVAVNLTFIIIKKEYWWLKLHWLVNRFTNRINFIYLYNSIHVITSLMYIIHF